MIIAAPEVGKALERNLIRKRQRIFSHLQKL